MKDWWIDELQFAGAEHLDDDYVASYERKAGFDPKEDIEVLAVHGLGQRSTLVDFGAGTGVFALAAARRCARVVAVDVSPQMVSCIERTRSDEHIQNLEVVQSGILSYEHAFEPADFVYSRNLLHQLPDFWKGIALERIHSVLRPRGIFRFRDLVFDFDPAEVTDRIDKWIDGAVDDPQQGYTAREFAEHVKLEFSTYSWLMEPLLERSGFKILEHEYRKGIYAAYTCQVTG